MVHLRQAAILATAAAALTLAVGAAQASLVNVDNTAFVDYVDQLKSKVIAKETNEYDVPTDDELTDFSALANGLWAAKTDAQLQALVDPADDLGYDVVKLVDDGATYFGVIERLVNDVQTLGWGSYFVRQDERRDAIVQAPHPLFDSNTPEVAARAFVESKARGFAMAGSHRYANDNAVADVAHNTNTVFHKVHQAWNGPQGQNIAWQLHGFKFENHDDDFPDDTDAVLSNGTGAVSPEIVALDDLLDALGAEWTSYAYNDLDVNDPLNVEVNTSSNDVVIDGEDFGPPGGLGATTNQQQQHSTSLGGTFVHIELEQSFRLDNGGTAIPLAGTAIADAIAQTTALVPEPATATLLLAPALVALTRRRRA